MYNIKKKKEKRTNNDPQNTTQVLRKDRHFLLHPTKRTIVFVFIYVYMISILDDVCVD
jgi:hypothetical protein